LPDAIRAPDGLGDLVASLGGNDGGWDEVLREVNRWFDRSVAAMRQPSQADRRKALDVLAEALRRETGGVAADDRAVKEREAARANRRDSGRAAGTLIVSVLLPAMLQCQRAEDRATQRSRNLHVAFALAAYQCAHGRYPAALDDVSPKYLKTLPKDLYNGQPLRYFPTIDGYRLYSVGENGEDDGGAWLSDRPPADDPRIRIPLPDLEP
ncbi:MAG: hypothetical protein KY476_25685, partial [Planctomycetes bacterium]|nr:hypothetical protein [Planctomycetota bacterium]